MNNREDDKLKKELDEANEKIKRLERPSVNDYKSQGTTLVLSILLGFIGILGIGHFYVGKKKRGAFILIGGLFLVWALLMLVVGASMLYGSTPLAGYVGVANSYVPLYLIPFVALYIWQIIDARRQCRAYNERIERQQ